jgi:chromate reductase, NAD(P)H dehydrogenase (quinone)
MHVTLLSGSPRKNSSTLRVAKAVEIALATREINDVSIIDFCDYDIPFINQGSVDRKNPTPFQKQLIESWEKSELIFVITPEYNWFPSAELVNLIHQLGDVEFRDLFDNKVFVFAGVSSGRGGRMPAVQLSYVFNKIVNVLNTISITSSKVFESQFTSKVLDENGLSLGNMEFDKGLDDFVTYSVRVAERWRSNV